MDIKKCTTEQLVKELLDRCGHRMDALDREECMLAQYGEVVSKSKAAKILSRARHTIDAMLADGRLDAACEGTRVDVRSIARYMGAPKQEDFKARNRRMGRKWAVS